MLEFFKQTKRKIENINNIITATSDKLTNPEFMATPLYDYIDEILKDRSNVISLEELEGISGTSYNYQHCVMLADILMYKVNRYRIEKFKVRKLFKTLVMIDYLLLNGVSAFIDLFKQDIEVFQCIERSKIYDDEELTEKEMDYAEWIKRKVSHIIQILRNKEKRLLEKEFLQNAKLKLLESSNQNLFNKHEHKKTFKPLAVFVKFKEIQNFLNDKFDDFMETLIGIIDEDSLETMNNERNRQMMLRGETLIELEIQNYNDIEETIQKIPQIQKKQISPLVKEQTKKVEQKLNVSTSAQDSPKETDLITISPVTITNSNLLDL